MNRSHSKCPQRPKSGARDQNRRRPSIALLGLATALLIASGLGLVVVRAGLPWARARRGLIASGRDLAKQAGLLPAEAVAAEPAAPGAGRIVAIDPGHGGDEIGAQYTFSDGTTLLEKDLNLRVALKVADLLAQAGYKPVLTRMADKHVNDPPQSVTGRLPIGLDDDLQARVDIANNAGAQLFLSIHFNGNDDTSMHGSEVYYDPDRPFAADSQRFAGLLSTSLVSELGSIGYHEDGDVLTDMQALGPGDHFYVLGPADDTIVRPTMMPAALAEGLFVTNADDATWLRSESTLDAIARAYATAVDQYFRGADAQLPAAASLPTIGQGTIAVDGGALLRAAPNTSSAIVCGLPEGGSIDLVESVPGEAINPGDSRWYRARYDGSEGYVYAALVQAGAGTSGTNAPQAVSSLSTGTIQTDDGGGAFLRTQPATTSNAIGDLPDGTVLDLLQAVDGEAVLPDNTRWYHVRYDGIEGYVYSALVKSGSAGGAASAAGGAADLGAATVETTSGTGALLRAQPATSSDVVQAVPEGDSVDLLQSVAGEAVLPGDTRWYRARYGGNEGYIYAPLVTPG